MITVILLKGGSPFQSRGRHVGADIPADEQISLRAYST